MNVNDNSGAGAGQSLGTLGSAGLLGGTPYAPPPVKFSINRFIVEPYLSDRQIKTATSTGTTGFAVIQQKVAVKGLRLLVTMKLDNSMHTHIQLDGLSQSGPLTINAGSIVYIKEEFLHTQEFAKRIYEAEGVGKFMIVDKQFIEFIQPI